MRKLPFSFALAFLSLWLLALAGRAVPGTACDTTSTRIAGPVAAVGCASSESDAKKAALLEWEQQAMSLLAAAGMLCDSCPIPGQCKGTMVCPNSALVYSCASTSSGNSCCTVSIPSGQNFVRMSCSACD